LISFLSFITWDNNFFFANVFLHYPIIDVIKINVIFIIITCEKIIIKVLIKYIQIIDLFIILIINFYRFYSWFVIIYNKSRNVFIINVNAIKRIFCDFNQNFFIY
jgi:hypothetical protein